MTNTHQQNQMANAIRFLAIDAIEKANSGHPGLPMGAADIATVLYTQFLAHDPKNLVGLTVIVLSYQQDMDLCCFMLCCIFLVMKISHLRI